jgi:chromosome partitioning protein
MQTEVDLKSIAFWNLKGGTGKTSSAGNVAAELRHYGRTLMIDADPQASLTSWFAPRDIQHELVDVMKGDVHILEAVVEVRPGLDLIPSFAIGGELREWSESKLSRNPFAFAELAERLGAYAFVVYDLHPAAGLLELSVLSECDEVVIVAQPEHFASDGIESADAHLEGLRSRRRARFRADRMIVNRVNRSYAAHKVLLEEMRGSRRTLFHIGQSQDIHDCAMYQKTLFEYAPGNRWTTEYQRLAQELTDGRTA